MVLVSVEPFPEVTEGENLRVTLEIDPPVTAGDPGLTNGKLIGGIIAWDPEDSDAATSLIAFAFYPGDKTDTVTYGVQDDGVVTTDRHLQFRLIASAGCFPFL